VAEPVTPSDPPMKPDIVDVIPVETIEPLMARHERELRSMRLELEEALREAEAAEHALNTHPAAAVFDDAFEADVLAHVARTVADLGRDRTVIPTVPDPAAPGRLPAEGHDDMVPVADRNPETLVSPSIGSSGPVSNASSPPRPRTVVVDRGAPRTVVVDRGRPAQGPAPTPPSAPPTPSPPSEPVFAADPGAEQYINWQASKDSLVDANHNGTVPDRRGSRKTKGSHASRLPARLLIQAGVVIVIIALLLLKLG